MAAFVKLHAPHHLLTVGEEGFYPAGSARAGANPEAGGGAASWAETEGQDFALDHSDPNIDFAAIHLWHQVRAARGGWAAVGRFGVVWCGAGAGVYDNLIFMALRNPWLSSQHLLQQR